MANILTQDEFEERIKKMHPTIKVIGKYINNHTSVDCECLICNTKFSAIPNNLFRGGGCPNCYRGQSFIKKMNNINPNIEIIGKYVDDKTNILCRCKIDGHEWSPKPYNLRNGRGCHKCGLKSKTRTTEEFINIMKEVNPDVEIIGEYVNSYTNILCRCKNDGYEWNALPTNLLRGTGCPLCSSSKGEKRILKWLNDNNILNISQKEYDGLIGLGGGNLTYDFYLPEYNILIEYQGIQHLEPIDFLGKGKEWAEQQFEKQKEHDRIKREYASNNKITLLEIWYYDFNNIETILNNKLK